MWEGYREVWEAACQQMKALDEVEYQIEDSEADQLLNYPAELYYGSYTFKAGQLTEFRFGFHYP